MIKGLREVIKLKDKEILGLKLTAKEVEQRIGVTEPPTKFKDEMNLLRDENN